jgi:hypothetical protein
MDEEGEMTRVYRPTGVPKLWFALGGFQQLRFFSKHLVRMDPVCLWSVAVTLITGS